MPAKEPKWVRRFSRASELILIKQGGVVLDLSGYTTVKIEFIVDEDDSTFYIRGTNAECTFYTNGTDGKLLYNPPVGGWVKDAKIVVWLSTGVVGEDFPSDGELVFRVRDVGDTDPAV